jgi:hypothetical protein
VTTEGRTLLEERGRKGVFAATRAANLAPLDCRVWSHLLGYGYMGWWEKDTLWSLFQKAIALNPYRQNPYKAMSELIMAKWFGSDTEHADFYHNYGNMFPLMFYDAATENFFEGYVNGDSAQNRIDRHKKLVENVGKSLRWNAFQDGMHALGHGKMAELFLLVLFEGGEG